MCSDVSINAYHERELLSNNRYGMHPSAQPNGAHAPDDVAGQISTESRPADRTTFYEAIAAGGPLADRLADESLKSHPTGTE